MATAIIVALFTMLVVVTAEQLFAGGSILAKDGEPFNPFNRVTDGWGKGIAAGAFVGAAHYAAPIIAKSGGLAWLNVLLLIAILAASVVLCRYWFKNGESYREMIPIAILAVIIFFVTKRVAWATSTLWQNKTATNVVTILPNLALIGTVGFTLANRYHFHYKEVDKIEKGDSAKVRLRKQAEAKKHWWLTRLVAAATAVAMLATVLNAIGVKAAPEEVAAAPAKAEKATATPIDEPWYHFYNLDMAETPDEADDYNFGPSPIEPKTETAVYDYELRRRMSLDPALGAADMAWLDSIVGTRYLGEFYESCKGDWAKTMNLAKERWMKDQTGYYETLKAFNKFLDRATQVRVEERTSGLDDQMYMNPFTKDGIPDIIVMETHNHSGLFLVYEFKIKDQKFEVAYRLDCGYQPTNVEKVMGIKPQPNPNPAPTPDPKPQPNPGKGTPTPTPNPPTPTPTPGPKKDPTKGTQGDPVKPNDDPGPGPNTNNPTNPNKSTEDTGPRSTDGNYEQYKEQIKELEDANKITQPGGTPNTPSTTPAEINQQLNNPPGTPVNVDSNADKGTDTSAPIDTPTPVAPPAQIVQPGDSNTSGGGTTTPISGVGEAWGGLTD